MHGLSKGLMVVLVSWALLICTPLLAKDDAGLAAGASLFAERCVLCHGNKGMGDGVLTLLVENYPSTNLMSQRYGRKHQEIIENIRFGGALGKMSLYSPPWENELSSDEIKTVASFVSHLYEHPEAGAELLAEAADNGVNDVLRGKFIFLTRCAVCHGETGHGDGKLAGRVIKNPPPYDLTKSARSEAYLEKIIRLGGAEMERSGNMPPWGEEFTRQDIAAVVAYLMTLRTAENQQAGDV